MYITVVLGALSIFGIWKIIEIVIWMFENISIKIG